MARGGARNGAGRPKGVTTLWTPEQVDRFRARIQTDSIIQTLNDVVSGKIDAKSPRVAAALGLLKKVMPDLEAVEHTGDLEHHYVARVPEKAETVEEWQQQPDVVTIQ